MRLNQLIRHQDDEPYGKQWALDVIEQDERQIPGDAEAHCDIFDQPRAHLGGMSILNR